MLGILDLSLGKFKVEQDLVRQREIIDNSVPGRPTWFCFLPHKTYDVSMLRNSVMPRNRGSHIIFKSPFPSVLANPWNMRKYLDEFYAEVEKYARKVEGPKKVLGVSFANTLAYKFANNHECEMLFSVAPGEDVPEGIKIGCATRGVFLAAEKMGYSIEDYRDALGDYSPENNLENLPEKIVVHLGTHDRMVPYRLGKGLVEKIGEADREPEVVIRRLMGHLETIALARNNY